MKRFPIAALIAGALLALASVAAAQVTAEVALRAAIEQETVKGDLKGAIAQYQKLADRFKTSDPAVAAKALLRMGECYDKLGDAEAAKAYERVVRDFPGQKDAVAEARQRLAAKGTASESPAVAQLALTFDQEQTGPEPGQRPGSVRTQMISRDGRYAAVLNNGIVVVHDLATGQEHRVASPASSGESLLDALISPDGKQVGYTRHLRARAELYLTGADGSNPHLVLAGKDDEDLVLVGISPDGARVAYLKGTWRPFHWDLCVAGADGSGPRVLLSSVKPDPADVQKLLALVQEPEGALPSEAIAELEMMAAGVPVDFSWPADGRRVMVNLGSISGVFETRLVLISVADGSSRVIPKAYAGEFSPDGRYVAFRRMPSGLIVTPTDGESYVRAYSGDVNSVTWTPDGKGLLFDSSRPDQPRTGRTALSDLYTVRVVDGKPLGSPELVKKDVHIGGGLEAVTSDGSYYYTQRGGTEDLYEMEIDPKTARRASEPRLISTRRRTPLSESLGAAWSRDGENLAYFSIGLPDWDKNALVVRSVKSGEERLLYPRGIARSEIYPESLDQPGRTLKWFPDGRSLLLHYGTGELFRFDTRTGEPRRLLDSVKIPWYASNAWAVSLDLSPDGRTIYYRSSDDQKHIVRRDLNGGREQEVCRVNADGIQGFSVSPDGSRLALVAFFRPKDGPEQRVIMTVAASGGVPTEISRPKQMARDVFWSKDGRHLIWATKPQVEGQRNELFSIPAEGGEPQPFGLELNDVKFLDLSSDGAHLVFTDQHPQNSLWVMKIPPQAPSATR